MTFGYQVPPTFADGQIVGRSNVGILMDNDGYWNGMADRRVPVMYSPSMTGQAGQTSSTLWDGYHYYRNGASLLHYRFDITSGAGGACSTALYYYDDDGNAYEVDQYNDLAAGASTVVSGTFDLASDPAGTTISPGIHRVRLFMTHGSGNTEQGTAQLYPPYTTYTNQTTLNYQVPDQPLDGAVSSAALFNKWSNNDRYFYVNRPPNPAFHQVKTSWYNTSSSMIIWDGHIPHYHGRLYYYVDLASVDDNNELHIIYDYGGSNQETFEIDTAGPSEDSVALSSAHQFGHRLRVVAQMVRTGTGSNTVTIYYLKTGPNVAGYNPVVPPRSWDYFIPMDDFTPGNYVYGNTTGRDDRLLNLTYNDRNLFERLCWNAGVGRMDFAVRKARTSTIWPGTVVPTLRLQRTYDTLYYSGTNITLRWGTDNSKGLDDADGSLGTLDLRNLPELLYGQQYTLTAGSGGYVDYALEV